MRLIDITIGLSISFWRMKRDQSLTRLGCTGWRWPPALIWLLPLLTLLWHVLPQLWRAL
jgi:hypothetical protein